VDAAGLVLGGLAAYAAVGLLTAVAFVTFDVVRVLHEPVPVMVGARILLIPGGGALGVTCSAAGLRRVIAIARIRHDPPPLSYRAAWPILPPPASLGFFLALRFPFRTRARRPPFAEKLATYRARINAELSTTCDRPYGCSDPPGQKNSASSQSRRSSTQRCRAEFRPVAHRPLLSSIAACGR